jgi:solute carrier family 25 iron transporter 28/37
MAVHPFDLAQTRLQTCQKIIHPPLFPFMMDIVRREGLVSLWRGFETVGLTSIPGHALYFTSYEVTKKTLNRFFNITEDNNPFVHLIAGVGADVGGSLIYTPSEIIKQNIQIERDANVGNRNRMFEFKTLSMGKQLYRNHGLLHGLYRGWWIHLVSDAPAIALYFAVYEQFKILWKNTLKVQSVNDLPYYTYLLSAGLSSGGLAAIFTPVEVVRTRIQVRSTTDRHYTGVLDAFKRIRKEEGMKAFYKGIKPSVLAHTFGASLTMLTYEECKKFFNKVL